MSRVAVLVADDATDFRELLRLALEGLDVTVLEAADFTEAVAVARAYRGEVRLVLLDYFMPGDRAEAVGRLSEFVGRERIVLCTACGDAQSRARELGLMRSLPKPIDLHVLVTNVLNAAR